MEAHVMDIYSFFNSSDVAAHCRSIGHNFNALESAVMINKSDSRSIAEKHAAYREIIANYPDMEMPEKIDDNYIGSFHKALSEEIVYEETVLERFLRKEAGAVYQATICYEDSKKKPWQLEDIFSTYEIALSDALENINIEIENWTKCEKKDYIRMYKRYLDSEDWIQVRVSQLGDITSLEGAIVESQNWRSRQPLLDTFFIEVPVPFKPGDLVEDSTGGGGYTGSIYVLRDEVAKQGWDTSDMVAWFYYYYEDSASLQCECMHFYPDLQYCKRELEGAERILEYVSLYVKNVLCLCHLLTIQKFLVGDMIASALEAGPNSYDEHFMPIIKKLKGEKSAIVGDLA
jgi:hypothetical protein